MKITLFTFVCSLLLSSNTFGQDSLVMLIDNQLVNVATSNAILSSNITTINGVTASSEPLKLTWSPANNYFYSIVFSNGNLTDQIAKVTTSGDKTILGSVTIPGETVYFIESISLDVLTGELYCSVSLNGNYTTNDYYSEVLIKVDTASFVGTIVGAFTPLGSPESDADDLVIDGNDIYFQDSKGGSSPFRRIYKQNKDMSNSPILIYEDNVNTSIIALEVVNGSLYFTENRTLHKIDLTTLQESTLGVMFAVQDFNGSTTRGLAKLGVNEASLNNLSEATIQIYPNPVNSIVMVESDEHIKSVDIFNLQGEVVVSSENFATGIDLSQISTGTYFLTANLENGGVVTNKIIKH